MKSITGMRFFYEEGWVRLRDFGTLGDRKRRQAGHLYSKKALLDIVLALTGKSRERPPLPGLLLQRRRGSRLGDPIAKWLGGAFWHPWF